MTLFFYSTQWKVARGVHGSGQVGFVPDLDSTRICWVGENGTHNRSEMLVGSAGSGSIELRVSSPMPSFWPDPLRSGQITTRSQRDLATSRRIRTRSRQDLIRFDGFQVNFCLRTPSIADFCMFSSENSKYR